MYARLLLVISIIAGVTSVGLAAYADHGLRAILNEAALASVYTALRYHQIYAVVMLVLAMLVCYVLKGSSRTTTLIALSGFTISLLMFSGSIYAAYIFNISGMKMLTPVGGSGLMISWLLLLPLAFLKREQQY